MIACRRQLLRAVAVGFGRLLVTILVSAATIAAVLVIGLSPRRAMSLPLYARQTGQPCATCHTAFLELTPFGRRFKLGGYTLDGGDWKGPPFAVMLQPTFTNTQAAQQGGAAPGFGVNNDLVMQQMSLFTGGRITDDIGAFIQGTYDGVGHRFGWDNTDIRFAKSFKVDGHTLLWGVTANNNPTVRDVWNTIPAWSFPYISSALAPMPTASTFIEQVYAQQVAGLSAYTSSTICSISSSGGIVPCRRTHSSPSGWIPPVRARSVGSHPIGGSPLSPILAIIGHCSTSWRKPATAMCRNPARMSALWPARLPAGAGRPETRSRGTSGSEPNCPRLLPPKAQVRMQLSAGGGVCCEPVSESQV